VDQSPFASVPNIRLISEEVVGEHQLFSPSDFLIIGSSILVIDDHTEAFIRVFDYSGNLMTEFGEKGEGPEEFIGPRQLFRGNESGIFWVYDSQTRKAKKYHIDDILKGERSPRRITVLSEGAGIPFQLAALPDDELLGIGIFYKGRISHYNRDGTVIGKIGQIPVEDPGEFAPQHSHGYDGNLDFDPERNVVMVAPRLGSVAELFNLKGEKVSEIFGPEVFYPDYDIVPVEGTGYFSMTYNKKSRFGFLEVSFSAKNKAWYLLYSGKERSSGKNPNYGKTIVSVDTSSRLLAKYSLDLPIIELDVDSMGTLFAMGESSIVKLNPVD